MVLVFCVCVFIELLQPLYERVSANCVSHGVKFELNITYFFDPALNSHQCNVLDLYHLSQRDEH